MSSFSRRTLLTLPLALAACGFAPVYGPGGSGSALQGRISLDTPQDRDGYLLTQRVEERFGRASSASFGLSVSLNVGSEGLAIDRDGDITRYNLTGSATFALRDLSTGQVLTSGKVENFTGYSATGSTVVTQAAARDARERLMIILADQITQRLLATPGIAA